MEETATTTGPEGAHPTPAHAGLRARFEAAPGDRDPSNGRPGQTYEGHTVAEALAIARDRTRGVRTMAAFRHLPSVQQLMKSAARVLRRRQDEFAELMTAEMGKTRKEGARRNREMRVQLRPLRRPCRALPCPRANRPRGWKSLRHLQPAGRRARRHALELPVLAGLAVRRPGFNGRQRRRAQAREQCSGLRARHRERLP